MNAPMLADIMLYTIYTGLLISLLALLLYPIALFIVFLKEFRQYKLIRGYYNELNRRERKSLR